jgi:threonylcarbamoyladenosine tRNA methylthiotransferase MtaB
VTVAFHTLGCKLNQYETEGIASAFCQAGHIVISLGDIKSDTKADLIIFNTCCVTSKSEQKARRIIRNALRQNPGIPVVAAGCYAQSDPESIQNIDPKIFVIGNDKKDLLITLPGLIRERGIIEALNILKKRRKSVDPFCYFTTEHHFRTRAFLKIQDGCANNCAYCRVTIVRGDPVSLDTSEVIRRVKALEEMGPGEIVLTGINVASYSHGTTKLADLLKNMLRETSRVRFRISSLEPQHVTRELLDVLMDSRICPHFHLSIQSGSESVLRKMKRPYNPAAVSEIISFLKKQREDCFLGGDIITGFPGERESEFGETVQFLESHKLPGLHIFTYSPRPGTPAPHLPEQVPQRIAKERMQLLAEKAEYFKKIYVENQIGTHHEALILKITNNMIEGLTENYLPIQFKNDPIIKNSCAVKVGEIIKIKLLYPGSSKRIWSIPIKKGVEFCNL